MNLPLLFLALSILVLGVSATLGAKLAHRVETARDDFKVISSAVFTLLSLLIGFTFSMAVDRYNQRKLYEAGEANAIVAEYSRAELLPSAAGRDSVKRYLREYLNQRIVFYRTRDADEGRRSELEAYRLTQAVWTTIEANAYLSSPLLPLAVAGMNDVVSAAGSTRAAWLNRIPHLAWALLAVIAIFANFMFGALRDRPDSLKGLVWVFPIIVSLALYLIADIDSPRSGLIHVEPDNLMSVAARLSP